MQIFLLEGGLRAGSLRMDRGSVLRFARVEFEGAVNDVVDAATAERRSFATICSRPPLATWTKRAIRGESFLESSFPIAGIRES